MRKPTQWFVKNTQQAVMSKVSVMPVIARTGPSARSGRQTTTVKTGEKVFVVGESEVGGEDRVGGSK